MSLSSVLSVARSGLTASQAIMQTAGHNIANVETQGYSRQRVDLSEAYPQRFPFGTFGTGVVVDNVRRARDVLLDDSYRTQASGAGAAGTRHELLSGVERVLGEPSDDGLAAGLDAFWSSWSDLANAPTSAAARSVVQQRARNVVSLLNTYDARLGDQRTQATLRLTNSLVEINGLADQVAQLNNQIVESEVSGKMANDLRDQRDLAIDKLAKFGEVRVLETPNGSTSVMLGNTTLVDGIHSKHLQIAVGTGATAQLALTERPYVPIQSVGGSTQALMDFLNVDLAQTQERLDAMASTLARSVNTIHRLGNDGANVDFFVDGTSNSWVGANDPHARPLTPGTVTARTIALSTAVDASTSAIATTSSLVNRPGDNDVALAMASLRTSTSIKLGNTVLGSVTFTLPDRTTNPPGRTTSSPTSLADFYRATTSTLATQVKDAEAAKTVRETLAEQADQRRVSTSGVNIDEELTTLMRAQQSYSAAAKVVSVVDEMMQSLIGMI